MMDSVGVVIPAYHPDATILTDYIETLHERLSPAAIRVELDDSASYVNTALTDQPPTVTVNAVDARRGKGAAITDGFEALVADDAIDTLVFVDADGSTPAESVLDVLDPILKANADLSVGSRRHPNATVSSHQTMVRRRLGDGFAWLARRLLDVSLYDYQCGAKALTSEAWREVGSHLYEPGFAWDIELISIADALDYRVVEVPVMWEDRPGSTVSPVETTVRLARSLITSRHRSRVLQDEPIHSLINRVWSHPRALVEKEHIASGYDADEQ
ncbi:glycosyltransferase [Halorubrum sp. Ea8]|uniref:glycosyltransferase n=1 Tax=Halorubrum sp. Ea8 TaxID=1383841 RepID=UPI000B98ECCE|nr:glycosyltransferase [Halorubrum sp. Ea8]OYR48792.1 dolichol-P-glucose transferase [Halorubrum sp. Ea8]